ncbi:alpha/beta hydrolase [Wenzhouxiangella sp. XN79A]|nr:alpha/beta hydrolase [Wenzhouxiangella sp. XN79A]
MPTPVLFSELEVGPLDHVPADQRWKPRRVYYATTREREPDLQRIDYNNNESDRVSVGMSLIGFGGPDISWSELNEFSRSAERERNVDLSIAGLVEAGHFTLDEHGRAVDPSGSASWLMADLNASIEAARDRDLLIYVHGAKVNFYNANAFAAQLDHFMGRDMTSMAFSWPTRQNIIAYGTGGDVRRAYRSSSALLALLEQLAQDSIARRIHIVTWSAGGRLVTRALSDLYARHAADGVDLRERFRLGTIYFAAADVPGNEFIDALPKIDRLARRIVVTSSSNDGALRMARRFMGGDDRIGQLRQRPLNDEQLDTVRGAERLEVIDMSYGADQRGFDITGHRYWFDHPWASSDLVLAIRSDLDADERALQRQATSILWAVPPDYPDRLAERMSRPDLRIRRPD